jgi:hypothetical protein
MQWTRVRHWLARIGIAGAVVLAGCGGGGGSDTPTPATGTVQGRVVASADSQAVADALVSIGSLSTRTAADGSFTLADVPRAARAVLRVEAAGFVDGLAAVEVRGGATATTSLRLVRAAAAVSFDAASAATVTAAGSTAQVTLPAGSLVNEATGAAASGTVTASVTPIDTAADPQSMPGDYSVSDTVRIESFGAIKVDLRDATGARLDLRPGTTATIRIPLSSRAGTPPASIPLWWFDEGTGRWVEEGSATLAGTAPDQYYEGQVSHFTFWNADQVQDTIYVNGCVRNAAGQPAVDALATTVGIDYSGSASDATDANGNFRVAMKRGGRANLFAESGNTSNTVVVGPSQTDITLETCLVISGGPVAPVILEQPESQTVGLGLPAVWRVSATGTRPLAYQWQRNGTAIAGATSDYLVIPVTTAGDAGDYTVVVSNSAGTATSNAATLVVEQPVAPTVLTPPAPVSVAAGATATFSVVVDGTAPLALQWQRDGVDIAGATSTTYTTPPTVIGDNGASFRVRVSNVAGTVTSAAATLTVTGPALAAPTITSQPADASVSAGLTATFAVATTGSPLPTYQWRRNGVAIAGATSASYTTPVLAVADSGTTYSVMVSNSQGSVTSREAALTVTANATEERERLLRLLGLVFDFYEAAAVPFNLTSEDGLSFVSPAGVCSGGSITGSFNGGALPAAGSTVPLNGTLAATASACGVDGSTYTGSSSVAYNLTGLDPDRGSATANVTSMRVRSSSDGVTIDRDITANGNGTVVFDGSVTGSDTTSTATLTPAAGATLRSELSGLTATFASGSVASLVVDRTGVPFPVRLRVSYDNLRFGVSGTNYLGNGFYELTFAGNGAFTGGSGEVLLTSNGTTIGRIFANANGVFIEVDGQVQPFGGVRRSQAR